MIYESEDAQLFYRLLGEGQDVVLLHPTPVNHAFWLPAAQSLTGNYRLILPDLRGHGQSQTGEGPITMARLARDVERMLDALEIERASFAGCSIGGYVLYELWRRMPQRVAAMAICCAKPQPDMPANQTKRRETMEQVKLRGTDELFDTMARTLVGPSAQRREAALVSQAREMMTMLPEAVIAVQQGLAARPDSVATAKTISVPTLVIAGGEDGASAPAEMEVLHQVIHGVEYHLIDDGGHFVPLEQPERVGGWLRKFFDKVAG